MQPIRPSAPSLPHGPVVHTGASTGHDLARLRGQDRSTGERVATVVDALRRAASRPRRWKIGAVAAAGLLAWNAFGSAKPETECSEYRQHEQITQGVITQTPVSLEPSTKLGRKAILSARSRPQPDLDAILPSIAGDVPAAVDGATWNGQRISAPMHPQAKAQLAAAIAGDQTEVYSMTFYDTCQEDGDWILVRLQNGMAWGPFPITNGGTTVNVPLPKNSTPRIEVVAIQDGIGGVTVGVETAGGAWLSRIMAVGQSDFVHYYTTP